MAQTILVSGGTGTLGRVVAVPVSSASAEQLHT
jgi:FlaA1/EpsC-like NDP-sugar epimerase